MTAPEPDNPITPELHQAMLSVSASYRIATVRPRIKVDGDQLDFHRYAWAPALIDDKHPHIIIRKGAQTSFTISLVLKTIDRMSHEKLRGALYLFPTKTDAGEFVSTRFDRILNENPSLKRRVGDSDSVSRKIIGGAPIYFRGTTKETQLVSVPADVLVLDERDRMLDDMVELAKQRLSGSKNPQRTDLSTPTLPNYGVDLDYEESDAHVWQIKCQACTDWTCLELAWPDAFGHDDDRGYFRRCRSCGAEINPSDGEWVSRHPGRAKRGYYISQLCSRDPNTIMAEFAEATRRGKLKEFHNSGLGLAYADIDEALTEGVVLAACNHDRPRELGSDGPCYLGADVGPKRIHWVVGERPTRGRQQVVAFGVAHTEDDFISVLDRYHVKAAVVDQMAETRAVRRIIERRPGAAWGCVYSEQQKNSYHWNERERIVTVNRTESLDESHARVTSGETQLPRADDKFRGKPTDLNPDNGEFLRSMCNIGRVTATDDETGARVSRWVLRGVKIDHYRHAFNYAEIASERVGTREAAIAGRRRPSEPSGSWMTA